MAWPPTIPPNTRANTTLELDAHPGDHNLIANALADIVNRLGVVTVRAAGGQAATLNAGQAATTVTLNAPAAATSPARMGLFVYWAKIAVPAADPIAQMRLIDPTAAVVADITHYPVQNNTTRFLVAVKGVPAAGGAYLVQVTNTGTGTMTFAADAAGVAHGGGLILVPI